VLVERVCLLLMVALVADVFLGVFSRYVLQATFRWYDEVARLCFIWIIFLGAAVAVRRRLHFRMHLVIDRFRPAWRRAAEQVAVLAGAPEVDAAVDPGDERLVGGCGEAREGVEHSG